VNKLKFTKTVATGNDFIIIKNKNFTTPKLKRLAVKLCEPKYGIGADGLLVAERSKIADLKMRIFNPDGSEAEMCGNGIRCFILWGYKNGFLPDETSIETIAGVISGKVLRNGRVKVELKAEFRISPEIKIKYKKKNIAGYFINTGVPHFVIITDRLQKEDVEEVGRFIRFHSYFKPQGTNVDFVQFRDNNLYVRTYERGVEKETLACGTGCVASTLVWGTKAGYEKGRFIVFPKSGERLKIEYRFNGSGFEKVTLEGRAEIICEGYVYI
jgi:diaminopimelate epimerase